MSDLAFGLFLNLTVGEGGGACCDHRLRCRISVYCDSDRDANGNALAAVAADIARITGIVCADANTGTGVSETGTHIPPYGGQRPGIRSSCDGACGGALSDVTEKNRITK